VSEATETEYTPEALEIRERRLEEARGRADRARLTLGVIELERSLLMVKERRATDRLARAEAEIVALQGGNQQ